MFGHANEVLGRVAYQLEAYGMSAPVAQTRFGLLLAGLRPLPAHCNRLPDILVVAGASPLDPLPEDHALFVPWLKRYHERIPATVSICTGAFLLAAAGVLDGRRATTHWLHLEALRERFPAVRVADEGFYVKDGPVWTSAGVTAGIDLALAMVEEDHGHPVAMRVAKRMALFLRRSGNQTQFGQALGRREKEPPGLRDITSFVMDHLQETLSVERIALEIGMSSRTLSRWCREHLDESPAEYRQRFAGPMFERHA